MCSDGDEPRVCHTELSQKEKIKCGGFMHIYGIWRNGTDEPACRLSVETWRMDLGTQGAGKETTGRTERVAVTSIHCPVWDRQLVGSRCVTRGAWLSAPRGPRGVGGRRRGKGVHGRKQLIRVVPRKLAPRWKAYVPVLKSEWMDEWMSEWIDNTGSSLT